MSEIDSSFQGGSHMLRIEKLAELCRHKTVYIQTHNFPDPDAIASAFGLQKLLKHYGVDSTLCYAGRIDKFRSKYGKK